MRRLCAVCGLQLVGLIVNARVLFAEASSEICRLFELSYAPADSKEKCLMAFLQMSAWAFLKDAGYVKVVESSVLSGGSSYQDIQQKEAIWGRP
jgi:hypothetical protein